jgi:hypothetical protein
MREWSRCSVQGHAHSSPRHHCWLPWFNTLCFDRLSWRQLCTSTAPFPLCPCVWAIACQRWVDTLLCESPSSGWRCVATSVAVNGRWKHYSFDLSTKMSFRLQVGGVACLLNCAQTRAHSFLCASKVGRYNPLLICRIIRFTFHTHPQVDLLADPPVSLRLLSL